VVDTVVVEAGVLVVGFAVDTLAAEEDEDEDEEGDAAMPKREATAAAEYLSVAGSGK
jgi:hypothetical protein